MQRGVKIRKYVREHACLRLYCGHSAVFSGGSVLSGQVTAAAWTHQVLRWHLYLFYCAAPLWNVAGKSGITFRRRLKARGAKKIKKKNGPPNCFGSVGVKCGSARSPRRLARTRPAGRNQVDGSVEKRSRRAAEATGPRRCYSPQAGFALPPGGCGDGLAEQQRRD